MRIPRKPDVMERLRRPSANRKIKAAVAGVDPSAVPDASSSTKGKVKLTNHLGGTADAPTVPGLQVESDARAAADLAILAAVQPLDSDLTAIASLTTTSFGRSLLTLANIAAAQAALDLEVGVDVPPLASPTFTGDPKAPTPSTGDNDTSIATTAFVKAQGYATLASPTFTGDPKAPTPATSDNDTSLATTAYVKAQKVTDLTAPTSSFSMNGQRITNSADATTDTGLVTYQQMLSGDEAAASGYPPLPDVDYVAVSSFQETGWSETLVATRSGNVLTSVFDGVLRIAENADYIGLGGSTLGVTPQVGDELLLINQQNNDPLVGDAVDNGIYVVTSVGTVSTPWVLTRRSDADTTGELLQFNRVRSRNGGLEYYLSSATPTINTDDQDWVEYRRVDLGLRDRLLDSGIGVVIHGTSTSVARPLGYKQVLWIGTATPSNRDSSDPWIQTAAPESWINVSGGIGFTNSWTNFGSGNNDAGYYKDPLGVVHLRGLIKSGTVGSGAFTLPSGYRPAATENHAVPSNAAFGRIDISTAGVVRPLSPSNNTWVSLDGITFRAA